MALDDAVPDPADAGLAPYRRSLHWVALALAASVFPLIWMGGLVTSHGVGLSVPDWPNSYGYNMFLFPPSQWLGGIFYEHTHRLLGTLSGFLAIGLVAMAWGPASTVRGRRGWTAAAVALWTLTVLSGGVATLAARGHWFAGPTVRLLPHLGVGFGSLAAVATVAAFCRRREPRRWLRWTTVVALLAVCLQGLLGGLRVDLVSTELAIVHGCFAQAFFCLAAFLALATSRWWRTARDPGAVADRTAGRRAFGLATLTAVVIFGQLIAGALMRHNGAGLAIPGVLVYGHWLPPTDAAGLDAANAARAWQYDLPPLRNLTQIWLHFAHRTGATLVTGCVLATAVYVFQKVGRARAAGRAAAILLGLLAVQVTLGVLTVYLRKPADLTSLHVATGALTLMVASQAAAVLAREYVRLPAWRTSPAAVTPVGRLVTG